MAWQISAVWNSEKNGLSEPGGCVQVIPDRTAPPKFAFDPVPQLVRAIGLSVCDKCQEWWPLEIAQPAHDLIRVGMGGQYVQVALNVPEIECRRTGLTSPCWVLLDKFNRVEMDKDYGFVSTEPISSVIAAFLREICHDHQASSPNFSHQSREADLTSLRALPGGKTTVLQCLPLFVAVGKDG